MLKEPEPRLEEFIENYPGKIRGNFVSLFEKGANKFIFDGPSGSGKSFLAKAFAQSGKMTVETINLYMLDNVEDSDKAPLIFNMIYNSAKSNSLFDQGKKLLFIEDIDKLMSVDPGILKKLREIKSTILIFESRNGEVFRAKNKQYVNGYEIIRFYKLNERALKAFAYRVLSLNRKQLPEDTINKIVRNARGNLSSVFTDLNLAVTLGKDSYISPRNSEDSIFEQLNSVFSGNVDGVNSRFYSDMEAKNFEIWIADKAPKIFTRKNIYSTFEMLSFADILLRKIRKQNWALLRYVQSILFSGVASVALDRPPNITYFAPNWSLYYN